MSEQMKAYVKDALLNYNYCDYVESILSAGDDLGKKSCVRKLQLAIKNELNKNKEWVEDECSPNSNYGDSIDLYGKWDDSILVVEIDASRADQVAKKMLSRAFHLMNEQKEILYVALCYPGPRPSDDSECKKYMRFGKKVLERLGSHFQTLNIFIDRNEKKPQEIY